MPADITYIAEEERIDLLVRGNLDLSVAPDICGLCKRLPPGLRSCTVDLSEVGRLFESGVALIQMLRRRLNDAGAIVVIVSDSPAIRKQLIRLAPGLFLPSDSTQGAESSWRPLPEIWLDPCE